jgi:signal transduction histidine kinase
MSSSDASSSLQLLSATLEALPARPGEARRISVAGGDTTGAELVLAVDADLRIVAANAPMLACLGQAETAVLGRPLGEALGEGLAMIALSAYAALQGGRQIASRESLAPAPGAIPQSYWLSFVPVEAGSGIALICTARPASADVGVDAAMLEASTREQLRLGHDLHDTLGQELATTLLLLAGLEKRIAESAPELLPKAVDVRTAVTQALESMRGVVRGLVPSGLESGGLCRILTELAACCGRSGKPRFVFSGPAALPTLPGGTGEHVYRFAQEAVSNIVRHARASLVDMRLTVEDPELVLTISDDGSGFDPAVAERRDGMGLRIMRHRALSLGGRLVIESRASGTRVALRVPLGRP